MKLALIGVLLLLAGIALMLLQSRRRKAGNLPKFFPRTLLTQPEQILYLRLVEALPDFVVLAQVQLCRLFTIERGPLWQTWFNKTSRKSLDFVICSKGFQVIAAIELDDSSHNNEERKGKDADKDAALEAAGIRLIRWTVKNLPDRFEIARQVGQGR
ncbi:hypothetical protein RHDC4_00929 [Rhodocyclaceae bacterium]|nr:hypothetical protein RHDC4_00929 [Rhodocyclaceae bacterium]